MTPAQPRVVVDARMATDGGIGTYLQELLPRIARLRPQWRITAVGDEHKMRVLGWGDLANVRFTHSTAAIFSIREQLEMPLRMGAAADLLWAPNYDVPVLTRVPYVVTIHDVNHVALPKLLGGAVRRGYSRWLLGTAMRRARQVLFDSNFTRNEARRLVGASAHKGTVVHLGVADGWRAAAALTPARPVDEPYFLYVGNIKKHKNVPFLLRAFARVRDRLPHRLLLIGRTEGLRADPDVARTLETLGARVSVLGEVPKQSLRQHMVHADGLVSSSLYEGFGLPALEAMASGTPCLVSRAGSFPEICGEAALYADPMDEQSFADQLLLLGTSADVRQRLSRLGRSRAETFSWDRSAALTADVLAQALA